MPEERLTDPELVQLAKRLAQARPVLDPALRDRLMFAAGRASATRSRRGWMAATGGLTALCASLAVALAIATQTKHDTGRTVAQPPTVAGDKGVVRRPIVDSTEAKILRPLHYAFIDDDELAATVESGADSVVNEPILTPMSWRMSSTME